MLYNTKSTPNNFHQFFNALKDNFLYGMNDYYKYRALHTNSVVSY